GADDLRDRSGERGKELLKRPLPRHPSPQTPEAAEAEGLGLCRGRGEREVERQEKKLHGAGAPACQLRAVEETGVSEHGWGDPFCAVMRCVRESNRRSR